MGSDPNVEDSQIVDPDVEVAPYRSPSVSPGRSQGSQPKAQRDCGQQHPENEDAVPIHHTDALEPDSYISRVGETQWVPLEPANLRQETQVTQQDSISLVKETQMVDIEPVTQAVTQHVTQGPAEVPAPALDDPQYQLSPASERILQLAAATNAIPHSSNNGTFIALISRPKNDLEDVGRDFQFAAKPAFRQCLRPPGKSNDRATFKMPANVPDLPVEVQHHRNSRANSLDPRHTSNDCASQFHHESNARSQVQRPPTAGSGANHSAEHIVDQQNTNNAPTVPSADNHQMNPPKSTLNAQLPGDSSIPRAVHKPAHSSTNFQPLKHMTTLDSQGMAAEETTRNEPRMSAPPTGLHTSKSVPPIRIGSIATPTRTRPRIRAASGSRISMLTKKPFMDSDQFAPIAPSPTFPCPTTHQPQGVNMRYPRNLEESPQAPRDSLSSRTLHEDAKATSATREEPCPAADQSGQTLVPPSQESTPQVALYESTTSVYHDQHLATSKDILSGHNQELPAELQFEPKKMSSDQQINDHHSSVQPGSRSSLSLSRPQSRRSNQMKYMNRPFPEESIHFEGVLQSPMNNFSNSSKVKKSKGERNRTESSPVPAAIPDSGDQQILSNPLSDFKKFLQTAQGFEEYLGKFEQQSELVEAQKIEIENLHGSSTEFRKKIDSLEGERQNLTKKINILTEICKKYKNHMNDVVTSQKALMTEAMKMKSDRKAASKEAKGILEEVRGFASIQEVQEKKFHSLHGGINEVKGLVAHTKEQQQVLEQNFEDLTRIRMRLNDELDNRVTELGREKHNAEQLLKQLTTQSSSHKELVELLKSSQFNVVDELTKVDSVLAKLLNSGESSLAKVEELSILINNLKNNEPGVPPALVTLIEDVYIRIEDKLQATDHKNTVQQESDIKLFDDLKERINQVRLDQQNQNQRNGDITQLKEANATMTASLSSRDVEVQGLTTRIDELSRDLISCRDQLTSKNDELTTFLASHRDDPQLKFKVHELEMAKTVLQEQLDAASEETSRVKDDVKSLEEASTHSQNQIRELEQKLSHAQTLIKNAEEVKKAYIDNAKVETEKAIQETANSTRASKTELQMRYERQVKNLEQRRSETESELIAAKDDLQKLQDEKHIGLENEGKLRAEISACKEQLARQDAQIKSLIKEMPSRELLENRAQGMNSVRDELADLTSRVEADQNGIVQELETVRQTHIAFGARIPQVVTLQEEKEILQEQNISLQSKYEILSGSATRHLTRTGVLQPGVTLEEWATTVPLRVPQDMGPPKRPAQSVGNNALATTAGPNVGHHDQQIVHQNITPREALQLSNDRRSTTTGNRDRDYPARTDSNEKRGSTSIREQKAAGVAHRVTAKPAAEHETTMIPKMLRAANRKSSNLAQEADTGARILRRTRSMSEGLSSEVTRSTVTRTTHRTEETTIRVETPRSGVAAFQDTPHGSATSSLTEVDIYGILDSIPSQETQDNLQQAYQQARGAKAGLAFTSQVQNRSSPEKSAYIPIENISSQYQSDEDELSDDFIRKPVFAPVKSPHVSTSNKQLKSALKNSSRVERIATVERHTATAPSTFSKTAPASVMQNNPPGRGVNKNISRSAGIRGGSDYNRVVSGMSRKPIQNSDSRGFLQSPQNQHSESKQYSPLPPASKRNSQKRKASDFSAEIRENSSRGRKTPRLSLPRSQHDKEIADSQEIRYRY